MTADMAIAAANARVLPVRPMDLTSRPLSQAGAEIRIHDLEQHVGVEARAGFSSAENFLTA